MGQECCFLPPRKMVPFQQEGLKLDLQKDFLTEIKGTGHTPGHVSGGSKGLGKFGQRGLQGSKPHSS